jgi:DNA replication protein DnaC
MHLNRVKQWVVDNPDIPDHLPGKDEQGASQEAWAGAWGRSSFPPKARMHLDQIDSGALPEIDYFTEFKALWKDRGHDWVSAALLGREGTGKTVIGTWAGREEFKANRGAQYVLAPELGDLVYEKRNDKHKADKWIAFKESPLLFIDEAGAETKTSDLAVSQVAYLIKIREGHTLPTILASNLGLAELATMFGRATIDRFDIIHASAEGSKRR